MKTLILQNLTHRGTVSAEGFLFSAKILTADEMRRRIVSIWQKDAKVFRHDEDLIVLFPASFRVDCRRAAGLPLVRYGDILSSFPLKKSDSEFFENSIGTIVLSVEGRIERLSIRALESEKVEDWFDVSGFQIIETETLGEVKTKPSVVEKVESVDLREELKDVPPADAEMSEILNILKRKKDEIEKAKSNQFFQNANASNSVSGTFGGIFDALKNLFSAPRENNFQQFENQPKPPGKLRKAFTKALFQTKLAQIVGRKQANYLAKMMEMFERGDLEDALKHAIPLEDMQALKEMSEQMPFLGFLRPRNDLQINYGRQTASSSTVFIEENWFAHLRELYRKTFDRLERQGRFEEAAFVLAELLKSDHEAVEFLEKHGKFRLAARLVESRNLPKDVIVRQWFLAGETRKAIQLAVLHNSFEYVVTKLEQQNHPQAETLREIWAENLAASGNYKAAVNTIWKLENKRATAADWIDKVIEFGGTTAAEMLAKKITLFPENFAEVKAKLFEILADSDDESVEKRAAFARETLKLAPNNELRVLTKPLARKILADSSEGFRRFTSSNFHRLVEITGDYTLRADLPKLFENISQKETGTLILEIEENDRGANHIYDACLLPDGKIAAAFGEAGVKIISKNGKTIAHFDHPTQQFIFSDSGTKAVGLAFRNGSYRLTKFDFVQRKAAYWCDASFNIFAPDFDGNLWFIGFGDELFAVDTNAKSFEAVWRVSDIGGNVYEISRAKNRLMLLVHFAGKGFERWWYELPSLVLRSRNQAKGWYETDSENQFLAYINSHVTYSVAVKQEIDEAGKTTFDIEIYENETRVFKFELPPETVVLKTPEIVDKNYVLTRQTENETIITLHKIPSVKVFEVFLKGTKIVNVKLGEKLLTVTDESGRVIIFDHADNVLRKNIRL